MANRHGALPRFTRRLHRDRAIAIYHDFPRKAINDTINLRKVCVFVDGCSPAAAIRVREHNPSSPFSLRRVHRIRVCEQQISFSLLPVPESRTEFNDHAVNRDMDKLAKRIAPRVRSARDRSSIDPKFVSLDDAPLSSTTIWQVSERTRERDNPARERSTHRS